MDVDPDKTIYERRQGPARWPGVILVMTILMFASACSGGVTGPSEDRHAGIPCTIEEQIVDDKICPHF